MKRRNFISGASAIIASPAFAQSKAREVAIGAYVIPGSPSEVLFNDYARKIAADSKGALAPNMLIHGEGGSEEQVLTAIRRGRIHVASLSTLVLSSIIPEMALLSAPYLFDSIPEFDFVLENTIIPRANALAADKGLVALRWIELGPQNLYSKKPIVTPDQIKNVRIRVSQDTAAKAFMEALGADVIYLASPDVLPSLQTGLIEGGITPTIAYAQTGLPPEAPHFTLFEYTEIGNLLVAGKSWLESLPADQADLIKGAFAPNAEIRTVLRGLAADALARQKEYGFTAHALTPDQMAQWRAIGQSTIKPLIEEIGGKSQELYDAIQAGRQQFAAQRKSPA